MFGAKVSSYFLDEAKYVPRLAQIFRSEILCSPPFKAASGVSLVTSSRAHDKTNTRRKVLSNKSCIL